MIDHNLINRCKEGDIEAFGALVEKYNDMAIRTAFLVTGRGDIAEDIAQEAFIQCFYSLKKLKNIEFFSTWFYRILVRTSWKMAAKHKNQVLVDTSQMECILGTSDENNPSDIVEAKFRDKEISIAIEKLSPTLKTVVVLYYYNGFQINEISIILDCKENTVKSRLHKARKKLEQILSKSDRYSDEKKIIEGKGDGLDGKSNTIGYIDKKIPG
ncbi:RNA polymerase sigma factor [Pseudobacteroides cellulosolvens]|uniref:RNA polymerase, sigma-24 subunit, RpoE, ECF subfamily n=1 Tax=Pseudobacteroides cellulosolvens ATCC 35603 = DSM 2933 TaxID=398512 RepID=A0A0L6JTT8_9FIRM|nr:RNA polymerase sigma factor [Pseudobacteroides cellulosolvens]KNY29251.1 RNA polymerase, sigma-24 subunit, RpoE, ECF subfamily [Pseudobacteroides cellulosolvens ATCC 35603 = DSM 2933]